MLETVVSDKRIVVPAPPEPIINIPAQAAPTAPPKPTRRTLSSIFGKDSKFASKASQPVTPTPPPSEKPESLLTVADKGAESSSKVQTPDIQPADGITGSSLLNDGANSRQEIERPEGAGVVQERSVAPTEAIHHEWTPPVLEVPNDGKNVALADGIEVRVMISTPEPPASQSHPGSPAPTDGDQPSSQQ